MIKLWRMRRFYWGEVKFHCKKLRYTLFGGTVREVVKDRMEYIILEYGYYEGEQLVGYWAHGYYDPSLPYTGQAKVKVTC